MPCGARYRGLLINADECEQGSRYERVQPLTYQYLGQFCRKVAMAAGLQAKWHTAKPLQRFLDHVALASR